MNTSNIQSYLNDHAAGATAAVDLIKRLLELKNGSIEPGFYERLLSEITNDRKVLESLIEQVGDKNLIREAAGWMAGKMAQIKLEASGMENSNPLGLYEAHEILVLGIEGKRLLWLTLAKVRSHYPKWKDIDFYYLEARARTQRDQVEERRLKVAAEVF